MLRTTFDVRSRWIYTAVCAIVAISMQIAFVYRCHQFVLVRQTNQNLSAADCIQFYAAAILGRRCLGSHDSLYDPQLQMEAGQAAVAPLRLPAAFVLQYPPIVYALLTPLSKLPLLQFYLAINAINVIVLSFSAWIAGGSIKNWRGRPLALFLLLTSFAAFNCFAVGTVASFLLLGVTLFWLNIKKKSFARAGLVTALTVVKLQFLPFLILAGLILGGRRFLSGFVVGISLVLLFCVGLFGVSSVLSYPMAILHGECSAWNVAKGMDNVRGVALSAGLSAQHSLILQLAFTGMALMAIVGIWKQLYRSLQNREPMRFELCAAITTSLLPLASVHTFGYDYVLLLLPCCWLYAWAEGKTRLVKIAAGLNAALYSTPVVVFSVAVLGLAINHSSTPISHIQVFLAALTLLACLACTQCHLLSRLSDRKVLLGQLLLRSGAIDVMQLTDALQESRMRNLYLGQVLVSRGWLNAELLKVALSLQGEIRSGGTRLPNAQKRLRRSALDLQANQHFNLSELPGEGSS